MVCDPARLPEWWPGVTRVEDATPDAWTTVLTSAKGRAVRADYTRTEAEAQRRLDLAPGAGGDALRAHPGRVGHRDGAPPRRGRHARGARPAPAPARLGPLQPAPVPGAPRAGRSREPSTAWAACSAPASRGEGRLGVRWWGWGEDGHDAALPDAAAALLREELGVEPGTPRGPVALEEVRLPDAALPAGARGAGAVARRAAACARIARRAWSTRRVAGIRTWCGCARATGSGAPDAVALPGSAEQVPGGAGGVRPRARGRGPVRRRHQRGGRRGAGARGLRRQ